MTDADPKDPYARLSYRRLIAWPARIEREAPFLREGLAGAPSTRLLDLGCGTGEHARFLQAEGFEVTGVDASEAQLAQAREEGPGPEFVKGDLAELGAAVTGPFGAAISLGNGLPHLHEREMASFLGHLARLLLPGAPVLFQILNYDRILDRGITSLPLNVRDDGGERVVFLRLMEPRPDGKVLFNPTSLRWRPGAEPPVEVVATRNVLLKGWRRAARRGRVPGGDSLRRDEGRVLGGGGLGRYGGPRPALRKGGGVRAPGELLVRDERAPTVL
ncbi:MAG TPA: class I SAM-dependent methyltransferase [Thermoanaerobaculia bacterium]|nr:class I SAM-dependent methyltransferase [Thermoanaerobaculia bacterium]